MERQGALQCRSGGNCAIGATTARCVPCGVGLVLAAIENKIVIIELVRRTADHIHLVNVDMEFIEQPGAQHPAHHFVNPDRHEDGAGKLLAPLFEQRRYGPATIDRHEKNDRLHVVRFGRQRHPPAGSPQACIARLPDRRVHFRIGGLVEPRAATIF